MMSRRFLHRFLAHWTIWMALWVVATGVWWIVARSDLAFGAFVSALACHALIALAWMVTSAWGIRRTAEAIIKAMRKD